VFYIVLQISLGWYPGELDGCSIENTPSTNVIHVQYGPGTMRRVGFADGKLLCCKGLYHPPLWKNNIISKFQSSSSKPARVDLAPSLSILLGMSFTFVQ